MKSNTKKRLIAFMLCMVLVLSSTISAFADELQEPAPTAQIETISETSPEQPIEEPVQEEVLTQEETPPVLQLTYEDASVKITVDAINEGNIPDGASLSVTPIIQKEITDFMSDKEKKESQTINDHYDYTKKKLLEKATNEPYVIAGFLAYDITFADSDGNKLEPNGNVKVSMDFKLAAIPEEVKKDEQELDVTVMHLEEDESGEVQKVVDMVADENETALVETTDNKEVKKAEFITDSFSTFTLTWNYQNDLKNQIVDESSNITTLHITDDIINTGALKAECTLTDGATAPITSCTWFRSDSEKGTYTQVEKVNYQASATLIKSNLSDDGKELYPAYDNGARKWYKARVTLSDETTVESDPFQVTYYNELQNGSFETPAYNTMMSQVSNSSYASAGGVWQTTGTGKAPDDTGKDIEILRNDIALKDNYAWNKAKYDDGHDALNAAYDQQQFAELNCQTAGALYQDVLTQEGTSLNYWLAHRARGDNKRDWKQGYDTMFLVIMPTQTAINNNLTTQTNLQNYLNTLGVNYNATDQTETSEQVYNTNGVMVLRITSSNAKWHFLSQTNGYTPASSLTRFFFMAGKTASTSKNPSADTIGNFLDNVGFSQQLPPVADDEFTLQVKKEFNGLNSEEIANVKENLEFIITAKKDNSELTASDVTDLFGLNKISGKDMTSLADGSLIYTISNRKIKTGEQYEITVTEENAELNGYTLNSTATTSVAEKDKEAVESDGSVITNLTGKMTATVSFKNVYKSANYKNVNFKKIWDDNNNSFNSRPSSLTVTLHASIVVEENGVTVEKSLTDLEQTAELNEQNNWECSWNTPVYSDYNDTKVKIQYRVTEGTINSDYVYTSPGNGTSISGDGSNYTYTDFKSIKDIDKSSTSSQKFKKTLSANALSLFANTALQSVNEDSGLGVPAHNKYINYNPTTSDYTLNLDVTGAKGNASGVDVLFIIDTSGSMGTGKGSTYTNLLPTVKSLLTGTNGIIDKILPDGNAVNSIAYVSFAGKDETKTSSWYTANAKANLKQSINSLRATGGTNWTYAMKKASEVLSQKSSSTNEKVVIFLSDGQPTYSLDRYGRQTGNGSQTVNSYFQDAADQVTGSLATAKFYSVYLTTGTKDGMDSFSKKLTNSELVDGTDLTAALTEILNKVIPTYKNVTITDVLSEYADFVEESPVITVTKKSASETTTLTEGTDFTSSVSGKTITVNLLNGNSLEEGATYTVSFKVKPSAAANAYYAENGSYPHTGDAGTGSTSAGQDGFYSNDNTNTRLTYSIDGTDETNKTASYPKPVVQVTNHKLTYKKVWNKPDNISEPSENVTLYVTYTDGTTNTITLTKSSHYHAEELVPVTKNIASIIEDPIDGYTPSYEISDNGTKATVTNSYSKITSKSITVRKIWNGNGPTTAIKVSLYQSSDNSSEPALYGTAILNDANSWTYTWNDLPQSIGSGSNYVTYTYAVREENIPTNYTSNITYTDYTKEHTDVTITNTYDPNCADESYYIANVLQTEHLTINKIWDDADNILNQRPDTLAVTVNNESFNLTQSNNWQTDVTIPKKLHRDYTATENLAGNSAYEQVGSALINATTTGTSITFVNKLKTTSLTVQKVWNDGDPEDRPETIEFELLYKNKNSSDEFKTYGDETYSLTEEDTSLDGTVSWTKVLENLPAIYDYKVVEKTTTNSNYLSEVTSSDNSYTITNTLKWSAVKTSENWGDNHDAIVNLQGAEFELKKGNTVIATGHSGEDGEIVWTVSDESVNLYKLNGDYTIHETKAPDGYMLHDGDWTLTFTAGLLTGINGEPVSGTAAKGVVITLTNKKVYSLPSTGGNGIYLYMIGGVLLMFAAAWILYKNKCREVLKR